MSRAGPSPARGRLRGALLALVAFAGGAASARAVDAGERDPYGALAIFARVLHYVETAYVDPVEPTALVHGALRGMLAALDGHSAFIDAEQVAAMRSESPGEFGGLGVDLERGEAGLVIVARHPGTPAERAGLAPGDVLLAVEGEAVAPLTLTEAGRRVRGPPGSTVTLRLRRARTGREETLRVVRERVRLASASGRTLGDGLALLELRAFSERTAMEVTEALSALRAEGPIRGLVLDLRGNPGGLLDQAVRVADLWLEGGVIVTTEGRRGPPEVERAHPLHTEPAYPIAVLVDGGTASSAEILAGALQDHGRAVLVGTQTFGKGSVQTLIELEDGSALRLTVARYFTPSHRSIHGSGIAPDRVVGPAGEGAPAAGPGSDPQLEVARAEVAARAAGQNGSRAPTAAE
jgi:carboxyl-terminal processing protease